MALARTLSRWALAAMASFTLTLSGMLQEWDQVWQVTGTVSDRLTRVPDSQLFVQWPWRVSISPNETVTTDIVRE